MSVAEDAYYSVPVSTLSEFGVFVGTQCGAGFCPGDPIDRKTMAVWIVRVLDGEDPEATSGSRFDDVDASGFYAPFIERMAELEVTRGCGDGSGFCPSIGPSTPTSPSCAGTSMSSPRPLTRRCAPPKASVQTPRRSCWSQPATTPTDSKAMNRPDFPGGS